MPPVPMIQDDDKLMMRAISLAARGQGLVSPNPMVGAVIVKDGEVVGEGFHRYDKLRHAESYALAMAGESARGATLYCSLEPCCHHGRTPPCTSALIDAGISRAVIAISDPDSRVSGKGIEQLRDAGIKVEVGLCAPEARRLNEVYLKFISTGLPFVHAAIVCEGPAREWQPSEAFLSRAAAYDAIMLGPDPATNRLVLRSCMGRERHRPLVVVAEQAAFDAARAPEMPERVRTLGRELESLAEDAEAFSKDPYSFIHLPVEADNVKTDSGAREVKQRLAQIRATSLLILPGMVSHRAAFDGGLADIVTLAADSRPDEAPKDIFARCLGGPPELRVATIILAGRFSELSAYPRAVESPDDFEP